MHFNAMYNRRPVDFAIELDAYLTGLGGMWTNDAYHLPAVHGYMSSTIVHLEMDIVKTLV